MEKSYLVILLSMFLMLFPLFGGLGFYSLFPAIVFGILVITGYASSNMHVVKMSGLISFCLFFAAAYIDAKDVLHYLVWGIWYLFVSDILTVLLVFGDKSSTIRALADLIVSYAVLAVFLGFYLLLGFIGVGVDVYLASILLVVSLYLLFTYYTLGSRGKTV